MITCSSIELPFRDAYSSATPKSCDVVQTTSLSLIFNELNTLEEIYQKKGRTDGIIR